MLHQCHDFALQAGPAHSSLCHGGHLRSFRAGRDRGERALCVLPLGRLFVHKSLRDTLVEREDAVDVSDLRRFHMRRGKRDGRRASLGARRAAAALVLQLGLDVLRILVEYPFTNWAEGDWVAHKQETPAAYSKEARRGPEPDRDEDRISDSFSRLVELFGTE